MYVPIDKTIKHVINAFREVLSSMLNLNESVYDEESHLDPKARKSHLFILTICAFQTSSLREWFELPVVFIDTSSAHCVAAGTQAQSQLKRKWFLPFSSQW